MELPILRHTGVPYFFGRTHYDENLHGRFFNWTGAGFAFAFEGTSVQIEATVFADNFPGEAANLPWLAVFLDDAKEPSLLVKGKEGTDWYTLFDSETPQKHTIRVVKRSENSKGRICLQKVSLDGDLAPYTPKKARYHLEFIGDSITCGFGNDMSPDEAEFTTEKENGFTSYAAIAAQLLGADYHSICISGIPLCWAADPAFRMQLSEFQDFVPPVRSMETYYEYADRYHQEAMGESTDFESWDFSKFVPDAIVINLGTNDAFRIRVSGHNEAEEVHFASQYQAFLHQIRRLNGPLPAIICTLGSMDYFLYDTIVKAVHEYQERTGDQRVACMKFGAIDPWGEGMGGLGHPNTKSQKRMAAELVDVLRTWLD